MNIGERESQGYEAGKPLSAQTSFRGMEMLRILGACDLAGITPKINLRFETNIAAATKIQAQNELRLMKMVKELEEEMKKFGADSESENDQISVKRKDDAQLMLINENHAPK